MSEQWTTARVPDLAGRVIVVTGGNSGIGLEAAKEFARKGATTVLACRNLEKAAAAEQLIAAEIPEAALDILQLDLADQASIHRSADEFLQKYDRLDVLVNNAGIMAVPYATTVDNFESQLGTNHMGHFALTGLLLERLLSTPASRVVNISSNAHRMGSMDFDNLMFEGGKDYSEFRAYGRSKLANLLFTYELQRRYDAIGADAIAVAAHPGWSDTNLANHMEDKWLVKLGKPFMGMIMQSTAMGALPTIRAAIDPDVKGGQYFGPGGFMEMKGYPKVVESKPNAQDLDAARKLWDVSEELTGVRYGQLDGIASQLDA